MWKRGVLALQGRPPDAASARAVILAFERGACEDWKAACLLGAIGHPDGYATALAILRSGDSTRASVYAGPALTKMWGAAAFADLAAILGDPAFDRRIHEGAAYGLAELADPRAVDVLMAAVDAKRVRMSTAGSVMSERPLAPTLLLGWLRGGRSARRTVAMWALFYRSASDTERAIPAELREALHAELDRGGSPFTDAQEAMLRERLARPIAPLPVARVIKR